MVAANAIYLVCTEHTCDDDKKKKKRTPLAANIVTLSIAAWNSPEDFAWDENKKLKNHV